MSFTTYIISWGSSTPTTLLKDMINKNVLKPKSRLVLAFASFNFDSTSYIPGLNNMSLADVKNLTDMAHAYGYTISLSVGGATYPFAGSDLYTRPGDLASNIHQVLISCGFDGVDFDIEDASANVPSDFANQSASLINTLRSLNSELYITLTTPAQAWASNMYQQTLLNLTIGNLNAWQPMEYDLWIDASNTYTKQITWDINYYLTNWNVNPAKIILGLMPGADDMGHTLSLQDALNLTSYAKSKGLQGIMTWDANTDSTGIGGNAPYAYTMGIQTTLNL